jgi:membrane associated rhomboid family serine protease
MLIAMELEQLSPRRSTPNRSSTKQTWREILQVLALIPLVLGGLLILTGLTGAVVWGSVGEQFAMGSFYVLFSFALSNALQKQWSLVLSWLFLGAGIGLAIGGSDTGARIAAAAAIAASIAVLAREFLRRRRQYLDSRTR